MQKKLTVRSAWKKVTQQKANAAVFLFRHGIEVLILENENHTQQFDKMLKDYEFYWSGVYNKHCRFIDFKEDMDFMCRLVAMDASTRKQVFG